MHQATTNQQPPAGEGLLDQLWDSLSGLDEIRLDGGLPEDGFVMARQIIARIEALGGEVSEETRRLFFRTVEGTRHAR